MELKEFEAKINRPEIYRYRSTDLKACVIAIRAFETTPTQAHLDQVRKRLHIWKISNQKEYAVRGLPIEKGLQLAVRKAFRRIDPAGVQIEVVDPPAHPVFDLEKWISVANSTNCFSYACDDPHNHLPNSKQDPGQLFKLQHYSRGSISRKRSVFNELSAFYALSTFRELSVSREVSVSSKRSSINELSELDNFVEEKELSQSALVLPDPDALIIEQGIKWQEAIDADNRLRKMLQQKLLEPYEGENDDVFNKPGHYLVALFVSCKDYHWFRQDRSGYWSHKPGHNQPTDRDQSDRKISDPRQAMTEPYRFSKYYYMPQGGIRTVSTTH